MNGFVVIMLAIILIIAVSTLILVAKLWLETSSSSSEEQMVRFIETVERTAKLLAEANVRGQDTNLIVRNLSKQCGEIRALLVKSQN